MLCKYGITITLTDVVGQKQLHVNALSEHENPHQVTTCTVEVCNDKLSENALKLQGRHVISPQDSRHGNENMAHFRRSQWHHGYVWRSHQSIGDHTARY